MADRAALVLTKLKNKAKESYKIKTTKLQVHYKEC